MTAQENANIALAEWQSLKRRYPDPGKRADVFDRIHKHPTCPHCGSTICVLGKLCSESNET